MCAKNTAVTTNKTTPRTPDPMPFTSPTMTDPYCAIRGCKDRGVIRLWPRSEPKMKTIICFAHLERYRIVVRDSWIFEDLGHYFLYDDHVRYQPGPVV